MGSIVLLDCPPRAGRVLLRALPGWPPARTFPFGSAAWVKLEQRPASPSS